MLSFQRAAIETDVAPGPRIVPGAHQARVERVDTGHCDRCAERGFTLGSVLWGVTGGEGAGSHPVGELNGDVQPGKKKSCLKEGKIVMWKRNGARFELKWIFFCVPTIK